MGAGDPGPHPNRTDTVVANKTRLMVRSLVLALQTKTVTLANADAKPVGVRLTSEVS